MVASHRRALTALVAVLAMALIFGVAFAAATAPVVSVENASNVEYTTADVEGTVNPEGQGTSWRFQYATEADFSNAQEGPSGFTETSEPVSGQLTGLKPNTTYHLRLVAENGDGQNEAVATSTFKTKPVTKPTPSEPQVSGVTGHEAHFEGTVDPGAPEDNSLLSQPAKDAYATHWWFTCVPACSFSGPREGDLEGDDNAVNVSADASNLDGNQEYTVILHASNAAGEETAQAVFSTPVIKPTVTDPTISVFDPSDSSATANGTVNPNGSVTDCKVVYGIGTASGNEAPCSPQHPSKAEKQEIVFYIPDAAPGTQYKLSFESEVTADLDLFATPAEVQAALESLPAIGAGNVSVIAWHDGQVEFYELRVYFVGDLSGKDVPSLESLPGSNAGSGPPGIGTENPAVGRAGGDLSTPVNVLGKLSGLTAETEYRYKIVASNAAGTTEGAEQAFTTLKAPASDSCSNAAIRTEQHVTAAAECRAYEMVSPADKNGSNITADSNSILAATDGSAAVFSSRGGFAGTEGSGRTGFTQYLSRRGSEGWTTKGITPTPPPAASQVFSGGTEIFYFSDNLSKALLWGFDLPQRTDDVEGYENLYRLDTASDGLETVTLAAEKSGLVGFGDLNGAGDVWGASRDTGVVSFASNTQLLPDAPPQQMNAYEWDHGVLRLAGILPNGKIPSGGSAPPSGFDTYGGGYRETVSADGSRVMFVSPYEGRQQLYIRRNHSDTVWVSQPEYGSPGEPKNVVLDWVSPDMTKVLFQTTTPLVAEDTDTNADLYLYTDSANPAVDQNLKLVSKSGGISGSSSVLGVSDDASRVYYFGEGGGLMLNEGGESHFLTAAHTGGGVTSAPGATRVSEGGRFLAFNSQGIEGTSIHGLTGTDVGFTSQLYEYDAANNSLACASCPQGPVDESKYSGSGPPRQSGVSKPVQGLRPRFLAEDGKVFFSSPEALVPEDTNGVVDTYVYDPATGHQALVTSGKGEKGAWFANASASGNDVFFSTSQSLVGGDPDKLTDLYDARVGGGFPEPPPPPTPCSGDNCRNPLSSQQDGSSPATAAFSGPGNQHRKPKHKHRRRHHKKHHRHSKQGGSR